MTDGLLPAQACLNQMINRDALDQENHHDLVTIAARVKRPHRDPTILQRAWTRSDNRAEVADRLGCCESTAGIWLEVYGLRERWDGEHGVSLPRRLRAADNPSEVFGDD